jgi:hypothetical protein
MARRTDGLRLVLSALLDGKADSYPEHLARLDLSETSGLRERISRRLVLHALSRRGA